MNESERQILQQLETYFDETDHSVQEADGHYMMSMRRDCAMLLQAFADHKDAVGLGEDAQDMYGKLEQIARLLERDFDGAEELRIDDVLQTSGVGICMDFDEKGNPDNIFPIDDEVRLRGTLSGIECALVPTEYALLTQQFEGAEFYEPAVCLILSDVEAVDPDGTTAPLGEAMLLPLYQNGIEPHKVLYKH